MRLALFESCASRFSSASLLFSPLSPFPRALLLADCMFSSSIFRANFFAILSFSRSCWRATRTCPPGDVRVTYSMRGPQHPSVNLYVTKSPGRSWSRWILFSCSVTSGFPPIFSASLKRTPAPPSRRDGFLLDMIPPDPFVHPLPPPPPPITRKWAINLAVRTACLTGSPACITGFCSALVFQENVPLPGPLART